MSRFGIVCHRIDHGKATRRWAVGGVPVQTQLKWLTTLQRIEDRSRALRDRRKTRRCVEELESLQAERERVRTRIDPALLRRFDMLLERRQGKAIVPIRGKSCGACGLILPAQTVIDVQTREFIITCESCSRFLYWDREEARARRKARKEKALCEQEAAEAAKEEKRRKAKEAAEKKKAARKKTAERKKAAAKKAAPAKKEAATKKKTEAKKKTTAKKTAAKKKSTEKKTTTKKKSTAQKKTAQKKTAQKKTSSKKKAASEKKATSKKKTSKKK